MKKTILLLTYIILNSCSSNAQIIAGDLYFKMVDITSPTGMSREQAKEIKKNLKKYKSESNLSKSDLEVINYFLLLEKNDLLESPYIYLKCAEKTEKIFLSKKEYEKVKIFTRSDLHKKGKKVSIELEYQMKDDIFYSDKILNVKEIDGETHSSK